MCNQLLLLHIYSKCRKLNVYCVINNGSAGSASSRKGSEINKEFLTFTWESQRNLHQFIWEALENMGFGLGQGNFSTLFGMFS